MEVKGEEWMETRVKVTLWHDQSHYLQMVQVEMYKTET